MIQRMLEQHIRRMASLYPVVSVTGPRQSGKTTLVQTIFEKHRYISLEDFDTREEARRDPRRFLQDYPTEYGLILDEVQHVPELLSYIQTTVDREKKKGFFVITGSQNLLLNEKVTQTLAGRVAVITLFPCSIHELDKAGLLTTPVIEDAVVRGSYPLMYTSDIKPSEFYPNYITTYVERDARQLQNIADLSTFQRFMQLCAGRTGQTLNVDQLSHDCFIDTKTTRAWLSILEASYIIFLLQPYYPRNITKSVKKSPKLYFVDTGVACSLLKITTAQALQDHYMRGGLVETYIVSDLMKQYYNKGQRPPLHFWSNDAGYEIDCIAEQALKAVPIEIKAGKTVYSDFFKNFTVWNTETGHVEPGFVVYAGNENKNGPGARVVGWKSAGALIQEIEPE